MVGPSPPLTRSGARQYRIIPSKYPPIDLFEGLVEPDLMDEVFILEAMTNPRIRDEVGDLSLVPVDDRVSGPGASVVMAAFTHNRYPSRFTDGSFGIYYAALDCDTAVDETCYHRARFMSATHQEPGGIDMRVYIGRIAQALHDIQGSEFDELHHPDDYSPSQSFGMTMQALGSWGLMYRSVRRPGGICIAALRPKTITIPAQGAHLRYDWDGDRIKAVFEQRLLR